MYQTYIRNIYHASIFTSWCKISCVLYMIIEMVLNTTFNNS